MRTAAAIRNPQSAIRNPQSAIRNPQSAMKCVYAFSHRREQVMRRLYVAPPVALLVCAAVATVHTQRGAGTAGPGSRQWWVAKAAPGQYGRNKPHIKLADLKARHRDEANWT